jgi:hypothetical protein
MRVPMGQPRAGRSEALPGNDQGARGAPSAPPQRKGGPAEILAGVAPAGRRAEARPVAKGEGGGGAAGGRPPHERPLAAPAPRRAQPSLPGVDVDVSVGEPLPPSALAARPRRRVFGPRPGPRLPDLSAEAPQPDATIEPSTLRTMKGIAALRTGATAGSLTSDESAEELDAALDALRVSLTPVRVSRTRLVPARRRRKALRAVAALTVLALLAAAWLALAAAKGPLRIGPRRANVAGR